MNTHRRDRPARFRLLLVLAALILAAVTIAACGSDDDDSAGEASDGGTQAVRVTSLPILDNAAYFWALDTGVFEKHGLDVQDRISTGGAADLPALVSGDLDFVYSNTVSSILAKEKGLPIKFFVAGNENRPTGDDYVAIVAGADSGITSPEQLEGKRMAVNTLNNINHLFERAWLREQGADPESVEFLEVPFPDQPLALDRGRVDATMIGPPFLQSLLAEDAEVLGYPYQVKDRVTVAGYITSEQFAQENADAVNSFRDAMVEASEQVQDPANEQRLLEVLSKRTKIDAAVIADAVLPVYTTEVDREALTNVAELMQQEGFVDEIPNLDELILSGE